nr:hypothetical protein [uncultured Flavobacterium sp.]
MGFSEKIQQEFAHRGLTNRDVSKIMDNYNETLISRYINSDNLSIGFIEKLIKYFPDMDLNYLLKDDCTEHPLSKVHEKNAKILQEIELIEENLEKIKKKLSQY